MIKGGYILQPRKIDESVISGFPPHVREIWLFLLRKANHKPLETFGRTIKRGQVLTSYSKIIKGLSWKVGYRTESYKKHHCDTAMRLLTKEHMVATTKTTRGMIVTICNYDYYQDPKNYETDSETDNQPTINRQSTATINKNVKNDKNVNKNIEERKQDFAHKLEPFLKDYGREMIKEFYDYWTEHGDNDRKMRFEKQQSFGISRRLSTWSSKQKEYEKNRTGNKNRFTSDTTKSAIEGAIEEIRN